MTYISDAEIEALPIEPEQRFIRLERIVRERLENAVNRLDDNENLVPLHRRYMSIVLPAAKHCGIASLDQWERPSADDWQAYDAFLAEVDYAITELRLRSADHTHQNSVALDAVNKIKLRHLLTQIKDAVDKLDVSVRKKEALYDRINGLQSEIDRNRTRWEAFAALMIEGCDDTGEAASKLEPLVRMIERVGSALGIAKRAETSQAKLPAPKETKQIEPPKNAQPPKKSNGFNRRIDEDIPF